MVMAFFDFDNTLIRGDSQALEIGYLMRRRQLRSPDLLRLGLTHWLYRRRLASSEQMVRACIRIYRGLSIQDVRDRTAGFHETVIRPLYLPQMRRRLDAHRRQGHACVLVSASVPHLLEPAAAELGIDCLICTRLESGAAGRLTGRPKGPVCVGAVKSIQAGNLALRQGADLADAWAYSDHDADAAFLAAVGHPVAVNPTPRLRKTAHEAGWPVMNI